MTTEIINGSILPEPNLPAPRGGELAPAGDGSTFGLMPRAAQLARTIAGTSFVKKSLRNDVPAITAAILTGYELGLKPMQSLALIDVIDGNPSLTANGMRALIESHGHEIWDVESTTTRVTMAGRRRGEERITEVTWTKDDATTAKLWGKDNWQKYPRAMLTARATTELARLRFSDVIAGFAYSSEEHTDMLAGVRDVVDVEPNGAEPELPAETPSTVTRQARTRSRKADNPVGAADLRDSPETAGAGAAPAAELCPAEAPGERVVPAPTHPTASHSLPGPGEVASPPVSGDDGPAWETLEVPGDQPSPKPSPAIPNTEVPDPSQPAAEHDTPSPVPSTDAQGGPEVGPNAANVQATPALPAPGPTLVAQVAQWARLAGLDDAGREHLCRAASDMRTGSARELTMPEAATAVGYARDIARGESYLFQPGGTMGTTWTVRQRDVLAISDEVLELQSKLVKKDREAATVIVKDNGYVSGAVMIWVQGRNREQLLKLRAEYKEALKPKPPAAQGELPT